MYGCPTELTPLADLTSATERLVRAIRTTEAAVLAVGQFVERIVPLATGSAGPTGSADRSGELGVVNRIQAVMDASAGFIDETRAFLVRQTEFARAASAALQLSRQSARVVSDLTAKSRLLALNMRIEAARLGTQSTGMQAIGQEMVQFSKDVSQANDTILDALDGLSKSIPQLESESADMGRKADGFAAEMNDHLNSVRGGVAELRQAEVDERVRADDRNRQIVALANQALSELQFHDPLVQELHAVIAALTGEPVGSGAAVPQSVIGQTDPARSAGVVELF